MICISSSNPYNPLSRAAAGQCSRPSRTCRAQEPASSSLARAPRSRTIRGFLPSRGQLAEATLNFRAPCSFLCWLTMEGNENSQSSRKSCTRFLRERGRLWNTPSSPSDFPTVPLVKKGCDLFWRWNLMSVSWRRDWTCAGRKKNETLDMSFQKPCGRAPAWF